MLLNWYVSLPILDFVVLCFVLSSRSIVVLLSGKLKKDLKDNLN